MKTVICKCIYENVNTLKKKKRIKHIIEDLENYSDKPDEEKIEIDKFFKSKRHLSLK